MRKLFAFFKRFQIFLLFAALQFFALSNYFTFSSFPRSQYLSTVNVVSSSLWKTQNDITKYINLGNTNRELSFANKRLREKLPQNFVRLGYQTIKVDDTVYQQQFTYTPARVINSTYDQANNYITINIGKKHGVERGMGVISDQGIVGTVFQVSDHFSLVRSILSSNPNIDVMIEEDGSFGLLKWETHNARFGNLTGISNDQPIKKWGNIITRGEAGVFPVGIAVGKVYKVVPIEGRAQWDIQILLSTNFKKIQNVYVLKNILKKEQDRLESTIPIETDNE
ncbi:MAG: rod shape-determining protein MreC [Crocinitomicaceae bacterium]